MNNHEKYKKPEKKNVFNFRIFRDFRGSKSELMIEQLEKLMASKEGENLEFKEAKTKYDFEKLVQYCAALANEGGGKILLGITDKRPRTIVGSQAFKQRSEEVV